MWHMPTSLPTFKSTRLVPQALHTPFAYSACRARSIRVIADDSPGRPVGAVFQDNPQLG